METDLELLDATSRMNKEALVEIFDLYATPLYRYALRLCGDPLVADHIVGDVFAKLLDHLSVGQAPKSNLRSYLFEATYNLIIDEARYVHRRTPLERTEDSSGQTFQWEVRQGFASDWPFHAKFCVPKEL